MRGESTIVIRILSLLLGTGICFAQSSIQVQTNGHLAGGPFTANAGSGQPFTAKLVTGRPFTAEATIETDQTLADASHVVNQQTVEAARDSQGRTYREEVPASPFADRPAPKTIFIGDPVAQVNYVLGPDHVARKIPMSLPGSQLGAISVSTSSAPPHGNLVLQRFSAVGAGGSGPVHAGSLSVPAAQQITLGDAKTEQLGAQTIAGVQADGTRTTVTIPAGQVGNQNPLVIITERWYSQDLQAIVLARHSDPRFGSSSWQLTNIRQAEPPASLFQIPSGYSIEEAGQ
jgi:hypothetical protein